MRYFYKAKIRFVSLAKEMGFKFPYCLRFSIERRWGGKIFNIGFYWFYMVIDFRTNIFKDMLDGINNCEEFINESSPVSREAWERLDNFESRLKNVEDGISNCEDSP